MNLLQPYSLIYENWKIQMNTIFMEYYEKYQEEIYNNTFIARLCGHWKGENQIPHILEFLV